MLASYVAWCRWPHALQPWHRIRTFLLTIFRATRPLSSAHRATHITTMICWARPPGVHVVSCVCSETRGEIAGKVGEVDSHHVTFDLSSQPEPERKQGRPRVKTSELLLEFNLILLRVKGKFTFGLNASNMSVSIVHLPNPFRQTLRLRSFYTQAFTII
jgi:hypothetical protein